MKKTLLVFILIVAFTSAIFAQQKYAVLICGQRPTEEYYTANAETGWADPGDTIRNEFWNDTYLMWEMLAFEKEYSNDNVFVLFADGFDYDIEGLANRYNAEVEHPTYYPITDYSATKANVINVFEGLATGTGGFPKVTEDDFLFVWTFGHGAPCGELQIYPCLLLNNNEEMTDIEFATLVNAIPAYKKVFWMQQCLGGSFADNLEAVNSVFHSAGLPGQPTSPADNYWDTENELIAGKTYQHGEFNFHVYSCSMGESPAFNEYYGTEPYTVSDLNSDNFISIYESWDWEQTHETKIETPLYSDIGNIGSFTSLLYPTLLYTDIGGEGITVLHRGLIGISKEIHVTSGNQLRIKSNAKLHLLNESNLIIDQGASLDIEDNVTISGNISNQIIVNGNIQIGDNVTFSNISTSGYFEGLVLKNESLNITLNNVTFNETKLQNYGQNLTISNSTFNDCYIVYSHRGDVTITDNTHFKNTWLYLENTEDDNKTAVVSNCTFTNELLAIAAIDVWNYNQYNISNNTIDGYYNGIQISQSGYGQTKKQTIQDNNIINCSQRGILAYNTIGSVYRNHISNNNYGVWFGNHSSIKLYGYSGAGSEEQTQEIKDNTSYEVYASQSSFPIYFRYNVIIDEDNTGAPNDPLVYYSEEIGGMSLKDVRYNCWGQNFNATQDLFPSGYIWSPTWCPGNNENLSASTDEDMYEAANNLFETENFADAKSMYEVLVNQYPESKFAKAALQELFAVEKFATNDYSSLKQYYATNSTIQSDTALAKLGNYLVSKCDVKLQSWPDAIGYCENIIQAPETPVDSIFAIIDLGYVYFVMENSGYKSAFTGKLSEYKPASKEQFIENRNYLLSLIPDDNKSETLDRNIAELKEGELLQNIPNPFSGTTKI